jgi:hypothetical protein
MGLRGPRIPAAQDESGAVRQKTPFFKGKTAANPIESLFFPAIPLVSFHRITPAKQKVQTWPTK